MDQSFDYEIKEIIDGPMGSDALLVTTSGRKNIRVVFHNSYITNRVNDIDWEGTEPFCDCLSTDVSHAVQNDKITIKSVEYNIENRQPLDDGWTRLILSK